MLNMSHPIHSATQDPHSSVVLIRVCDREKQLSTAAAATVLFSVRIEQARVSSEYALMALIRKLNDW